MCVHTCMCVCVLYALFRCMCVRVHMPSSLSVNQSIDHEASNKRATSTPPLHHFHSTQQQEEEEAEEQPVPVTRLSALGEGELCVPFLCIYMRWVSHVVFMCLCVYIL